MGVTNVISYHNVTTVGQPTENTPDMYSLVDTTGKVVVEQIVDETLLASQRNIDSRLTSVDLRDANTPPGDEVENEEEPHYWSQMNLQDQGMEFEADEEMSSRENVKDVSTKLNV